MFFLIKCFKESIHSLTQNAHYLSRISQFFQELDYQWYSLQFTYDKDYQWPYNVPKMQNTNTANNQKKSESGIVTNPL